MLLIYNNAASQIIDLLIFVECNINHYIHKDNNFTNLYHIDKEITLHEIDVWMDVLIAHSNI